MGKSLKVKALSRVFSEDYGIVKKRVLDPQGQAFHRWSQIFYITCLLSVYVDPVFFYLPMVKEEVCIDMSKPLAVTLTVIRSIADVFYMIQILVQFRTAYVAPSSRVLGRGELVIDTWKIALRYLGKGFCMDLIAALPLPQVLLWVIFPRLQGPTITYRKNILLFVIVFQYIPRLILIYPLSSQIAKATGVVTKTSWAGAVYNLNLFMLASHAMGALYFLESIVRQETCWMTACDQDPSCQYGFFNCQTVDDPSRVTWFQSNNVTTLCVPVGSFYNFGIYAGAYQNDVTNAKFFNKFFYCYYFGLKNLCTFGQNLLPSTYIMETSYIIVMGVLGLVLLSLLIANMQRYLISTLIRVEQWRLKRTDTEQWMHHRQLPPELRQAVRKYNKYKWVATRGVDEKAILDGLPVDLRRKIKRHLCLDLIRRVPLFDQMDERTLDAIFERLKPALRTEGTFEVRESDPVNEMLFIVRGHLDSYTTDRGRTGFLNSCRLGPGDFCGEELLTWALDPRPIDILPSSTRTVKAISEVEGFVLLSEDLKFVAAQFRRLHSKKIRHMFRFYSHQWRTWAACSIQLAWRRFKKYKDEVELEARENFVADESELFRTGLALAVHSARRAESFRRSVDMYSGSESGRFSPLPKPTEPDFSVYEE